MQQSPVPAAARPAPLLPMLPRSERLKLGAFQMRLLSPDDAAQVLALRHRVLARLPDPELYLMEPDEGAFVAEHLGLAYGGKGETIGVFDGPRLIAYATLSLPAPDAADNLGLLLPLDPQRRGEVGHIASCMVLDEYRGHSLQRALVAARFLIAQANGRTLCVATASPRNHASRRNLMREGMRILHAGEIRGLRRHLFALDLAQPWQFLPEQALLVDGSDFERHARLAASGWWGVSALEGRAQDVLVFARAVQAHVRPLRGSAPRRT